MAILGTFLCWDNTRIGSAVSAYYTLIISVTCVSFYVFRYLALDVINSAVEYKSIVYPGFALYAVMIAVSLIMLPGVYMDNRHLLLPWIYVLVVTVLYETGAIALLTTIHLSSDKVFSGWDVSSLCFYGFRLLANCYCFACVVSQYQELSEGRGTYDYLNKPRRRHNNGAGLTVVDGDLYHPPYGAQLPPYSKFNQHKCFGPPDYENVCIVCDNAAFCTDFAATRATSCLTDDVVCGGTTTDSHLPVGLWLELLEQRSATEFPPDGREPMTAINDPFGRQERRCAECQCLHRHDVYQAGCVSWI